MGDPFMNALLAAITGSWPWLLAIAVACLLMVMRGYSRRSLDKAWEAEFIRTARTARQAGVTVTDDDTIVTMEQKIADHRAAPLTS